MLHGTVDFVQANIDNILTIVEEHAPVYTLYNLVYITRAVYLINSHKLRKKSEESFSEVKTCRDRGVKYKGNVGCALRGGVVA